MLPENAFKYNHGLSAREVLVSVNVLRHSAVHRLHTSAKGIDQMIQSAAIFASTLGDTDRESQLEQLHAELESKIRAQELNKNFLEEKLASELDEIREIRKELDRREQEAIKTLFREDSENKSLVGSMLEESVRGIFNLPGYSNGAAGKQDETPDEAEIDDFLPNEVPVDISQNAVEKSPEAERLVEWGEPFSPFPEEPMQEEEPTTMEEFAPIESPVEGATAEEMWPLEEPEMDGTPMPIEGPMGTEISASMREPVMAGERFTGEAKPIPMQEAVEAPIEELVLAEVPVPEQPTPEQEPTKSDIDFEEPSTPVNGVLDYNGVHETYSEQEQATTFKLGLVSK
jgi:hypothetical protein